MPEASVTPGTAAVPEVSIIVPVYNERQAIPELVRRLETTFADWPRSWELILVDDGSDDGTGFPQDGARLRVVRHPRNLGNGAAVKTGIRAARGAWCAVLDGDGQHDPVDLKKLIEGLSDYHLVVGSRDFRSDGSLCRNLANRFYRSLASYVAEYQIADLTSGIRAFRRSEVLEIIHLLPNRFSYPTTMTMSFLRLGYAVGFVPVKVAARKGQSKIKPFSDGLRFLLIILKIATLFSPLRLFAPVSFLMFSLGVLNYFSRIIGSANGGPLWSVLLVTNAVIIFMIGLLAEEISTLKFRGK